MSPAAESCPIVLLGCGNVLAADDGVGIRVIRELARLPLPRQVQLVEAGVAGLGLLDYFHGQQKAIIVDAVLAGREPGTVLCFRGSELPEQGLRSCSLHGLGLLEALQLGYRLEPGRMPGELVIVGVQAQRVDSWQEGLSPEVEAAVPKAIAAVLAELPSNIALEVAGSA